MSVRSTSGSPSRRQLLKELDESARRLGALSVLVSDLVATRVGLNPTDLECLDLLCLAGATTAGRLAAHTGLTSGATTAAIDRLEEAGFVTRRRGAEDRRQVLVDVKDAGIELIFPFYRPLAAGFENVHARYTDRQLATVLQYFNDALESMSEHVAWLQTQPALSGRRTRHPVTTAPSRPAASSSTSSPEARRVGRPARRVSASRNHS